MRLILQRAEAPLTFPNEVLHIPMTEKTQKLAKRVNKHLQELRKLADQHQAGSIIPGTSDEPTTAISAHKEITAPATFPKLVSTSPCWDTRNEITQTFLTHMKDLFQDNPIILQILNNLPRYVAITTTPFVTTLVDTANNQVTYVTNQAVPTLHTMNLQHTFSTIAALDETHILYDARINDQIEKTIMQQIINNTTDLNEHETEIWKRIWVKDAIKANATLNPRITKIRVDQLFQTQPTPETPHSDHEFHLLENLDTIRLDIQETRDTSTNSPEYSTVSVPPEDHIIAQGFFRNRKRRRIEL